MVKIKFATMHPDAKIPTKKTENAGYDIYAAFDEDFIEIEPCETKMIPTGICSAFPEEYVMVLKERGSTGTKGMGQRSGVVDSGYRGQWFVPITNHNKDASLFISKLSLKELTDYCYERTLKQVSEGIDEGLDEEEANTLRAAVSLALMHCTVYPYEKAIAQALLLPVPYTNIVECTLEEIMEVPSERGTGALGSSGK